ncbi:hypothetical protein AGDE_14685 [Angomonas deanei]|nr:hypothetical protein AGDE_14685 [Angomonas deanei]|eukprot:EPY20415.1 hypothetical protein AGDE_14685 [Angomonas deanei]
MVVCTATSRYTRVFNLKGEVMGELGMNTWNDKDPSTFRFMNETRAPGAPPPAIASSFARAGVTDVEFDYLEDALITQHIAMATGKKPRKSRQRSLTGSVVLNASGTLQGNEAGETQRFGGSISKPNPDHVMLGEALKTLNSIGANVSPVPQEDATTAASASQKSTNKDGTAPALTTVLRQSTRQRYLEEPTYRGIVKKGYANRIRQQTAVELANIIPTSPDDEDMLLPNVFPGEASSFFDAAQYSELLDKGYVPTVSNTLAPSAATAKHNPQYNQSLTSPDVSHDSPFDHSLAAPPRVQSSQPRRDSLTLRNRGADPPLGTASLSPNTGPFYPTDRTPDLPAVLPSASSDPTPRGVSRSWDRPSVAKGLTGSRQQGVRSNRNVMLVKNGGEEVSEEALVQQHMAQFRSQLTKSLKNSEQQLPPETVRTKKEEMQTLVNSVLQKDGKGGRTPVNLLGGAGKGRDNHSYLERVMVAPIDAGLSAGATAPATVERPTAKHTTKHGTKTKAI